MVKQGNAQLKRHGRDAVESWTLLRETEDDEVVFLAGGQELADCALRYNARQAAAGSA